MRTRPRLGSFAVPMELTAVWQRRGRHRAARPAPIAAVCARPNEPETRTDPRRDGEPRLASGMTQS
jgi:hypothetical protein